MNKHIYNKSNGIESFELKEYDGSIVPIGYYYESDIQGRLKEFKSQLNETVFPILERIIRIEIPKQFILTQDSISISIFGTNLRNENSYSSFEDFQKIISEIEFLNNYEIDLYVNIEFTARNNNKIDSYGCQIHIMVGSETIQDIMDDTDLTIWFLYLGSEKIILERRFNEEVVNNIINYFLDTLKKSV